MPIRLYIISLFPLLVTFTFRICSRCLLMIYKLDKIKIMKYTSFLLIASIIKPLFILFRATHCIYEKQRIISNENSYSISLLYLSCDFSQLRKTHLPTSLLWRITKSSQKKWKHFWRKANTLSRGMRISNFNCIVRERGTVFRSFACCAARDNTVHSVTAPPPCLTPQFGGSL